MTANSVVAPGLIHGFGPRPVARDLPHSPDAAVEQLCRQMRDVCASAVDPLEIAAALEAEAGLTGPMLRARYGCADVFELADEMYRRTVRWPGEPPAQPQLWAANPRTHVGHAVLYGLPAASYAVAAPLLSGTPELTAALVSMVLSWTLSQALAHLGYARMSRLDAVGAARVLRVGLAAGTVVLGAALAVATTLAPVGAAVLVFAAAQGEYLLAATVLLVRKAERWVFAALLPSALASVAYLLAGRPAMAEGLLWLPLVVSAVLACGAAVALTRTRGPRGRLAPGRTELRGALSQAQFGLSAAGLLAFPVAVNGFGAGSNVSAVAVLTLPLSLSMGAAEWSLYRYRRDVQALLERCRTPRQFGPGAQRVLLGAVLRYLAVAAALVATTVAVLRAAAADTALGTAAVLGVSYLALGGALFLALLLQALGAGVGTGTACAAALGLEAALVLAPQIGTVAVPAAQLISGALLFTGLSLVASTRLRRVESHI